MVRVIIISLQGSFATMKPLLSHGGILASAEFSANPTVVYNVVLQVIRSLVVITKVDDCLKSTYCRVTVSSTSLSIHSLQNWKNKVSQRIVPSLVLRDLSTR
jgi:hypothetical protein